MYTMTSYTVLFYYVIFIFYFYARLVLLIAMTKATKLKDITKPPSNAGNPESLIIFNVFFLYVINKNIIIANRKKKDLKNRICQTFASSKDLTIKPPQLKQKPPNISKI